MNKSVVQLATSGRVLSILKKIKNVQFLSNFVETTYDVLLKKKLFDLSYFLYDYLHSIDRNSVFN